MTASLTIRSFRVVLGVSPPVLDQLFLRLPVLIDIVKELTLCGRRGRRRRERLSVLIDIVEELTRLVAPV